MLVVLGVLVALLLNERFPGNTLLRAGMLLPWAIPASVVGVIWKWVFLDSWGALNAGLYSLGLIDNYISWLTTPWLARFAVIVAFTWSQLPLVAILLLAALQAIPDELYEAAAIDGASAVSRFWAVTLPGIRPMLVIVTLYEILMALNVFDITYAMTGGGPGTATSLLTYYIWAETFKMLNFGNGAALAVVIALLALAFIAAIVRALPKSTHETTLACSTRADRCWCDAAGAILVRPLRAGGDRKRHSGGKPALVPAALVCEPTVPRELPVHLYR